MMLTKNEESFLKRYEADLRLPKLRFALKYGLSWAFMVLIFTSIANLLFDFQPELWKSGKSIATALGTWFLAGLAYGFLFRSLVAKRCRQLSAKKLQ